MDYEKYAELRRGLGMLQEEFRRCFRIHPRLYNQFILTPDPNNPLSNEAWDAFIDANRRGSGQKHGEWEDWEVFPNRSVCSRFHGSEDRGAVTEFRRTAESAYDSLLELQFLHEEEQATPDGFRLVLPKFVGATGWRPVDTMFGWLTVVYQTAFACHTPFLHADHRLWGRPDTAREIEKRVGHATHIEWEVAHATLWEEAEERNVDSGENSLSFPAHPAVQSLRHDVFRSSVEAINVWLNSDQTAWITVEDEPPIWLPPSGELDEVTDEQSHREHVDQAAEPEKTKKVTPVWDEDLGTLSVGDVVVKKYTRYAPNPSKILTEFQKMDWLPRIDDPIGKGDDRLRAAVNDLNKSLDVKNIIRFGTRAKGVIWDFVEQP